MYPSPPTSLLNSLTKAFAAFASTLATSPWHVTQWMPVLFLCLWNQPRLALNDPSLSVEEPSVQRRRLSYNILAFSQIKISLTMSPASCYLFTQMRSRFSTSFRISGCFFLDVVSVTPFRHLEALYVLLLLENHGDGEGSFALLSSNVYDPLAFLVVMYNLLLHCDGYGCLFGVRLHR